MRPWPRRASPRTSSSSFACSAARPRKGCSSTTRPRERKRWWRVARRHRRARRSTSSPSKAMRSFEGVHGPVTTPFRADGELDRQAFEKNVRAHLSQGLHGIVATGSTGEAPLLDEHEREQLVGWARKLVPSDKLLIAGLGAESTRVTIERARRVAQRGADAALVVAPHYFGAAVTEDGLRGHYSRLADASPIPILLYNIPKYMHFRLSGALVSELARHGNIVGIKDSSGAQDSMQEYLAAQSATFTVLTGNG